MSSYIETLVNFVAVTPGGGGGGDVPGGGGGASWGAQTSDVLGIVIAVLLAVVCIAFFAMRIIAKSKIYETAEAQATGTAKLKTTSTIMLVVIAALACAVVFNMTSMQSAAKQADNGGSITSPAYVEAHVDDLAGTITIDNSYFLNPNENDIDIKSITVSNPEGIDDGGYTWNIYAMGATLYNDAAGNTLTFEEPKTLASGAKEDVKITTNMDIETAKSLIGKSVLKMNFSYADSPVPPPPPPPGDQIEIKGVAVDADGLPIANATVTIYDEAGNAIATVTTDSQGNYTLTLPEGTTSLEKGVIKVKTEEGISQDIIVKNVTDDVTLTENSIVEPATTVSGVIKDENGNPVPGVEVTFTTQIKDPDGTVRTETFTTTTGPDGTYKIEVKQNHEYIESAEKGGENPVSQSGLVDVEDKPITENVNVDTTLLTVTVDLGSGSVQNVPDGWTSSTAGVYTKQLGKGSDISSIEYLWIGAGVKPDSTHAFIRFDNNAGGDELIKDTQFSAVYDTHAYIKGLAFDEEGQPLTQGKAVFIDENGKRHETPLDNKGGYLLEIPPNTSGTFFIEGAEDEKSSEFKIDKDEGVTKIPDTYVEPITSIGGTVTGPDGQPLKNTEIEITTYVERDGEIVEEKYYVTTDNDGRWKKTVQQNKDYSIKIPIPGTNPPIYFTEEVKVDEAPVSVPTINVPSEADTYVATINLNGGKIYQALAGWKKTVDGTYQKTFAKNSRFEAITSEWTYANITPPQSDLFIAGWEPPSGQLTSNTSFKAIWGASPTPTQNYISGTLVDEYGNPAANVDVVFTDDDGTVYKGKSGDLGNYKIGPIPNNTHGILTYSDPSSKPPKIGAPQEITVETDSIILNKSAVEPSNVASGEVLDSNGNPIANADVILKTATYIDGQKVIETYTGKTDGSGFYKIEVKDNKTYELEIKKEDGTSPFDYIDSVNVVTGDKNPIKIQIPPDSMVTYKVDIGQGNISSEDIPDGWTKSSSAANAYEKEMTYSKNTDVAVMKLWAASKIVPPSGQILSMIVHYGEHSFVAKYVSKKVLSGTVKDNQGQPVFGAIVKLYDEEGNVVNETTTNEDGSYEFDVAQGNEYKVKATTPEGTTTEYNVGIVEEDTDIPEIFIYPKSNVSFRVLDNDQIGIPNAKITFKYRDDTNTEISYTANTNINGHANFDVVMGHTYYVTVQAIGFSSFITELPVTLPSHKFSCAFKDVSYDVKVSGFVLPDGTEGPQGWSFETESKTWIKNFAINSSVAGIMSQWDGYEILPVEAGSQVVFGGWNNAEGKLEGDRDVTPIWKGPELAKGVMRNDGVFTLYYDAHDYSSDDGVTGQYVLTQNTAVNFETLQFNLAPWHNAPTQSNPVPTPKIQPTQVVFDTSFSSFQYYHPGPTNEYDKFTSMAGWFFNMTSIQSFEGFDNIYDSVTDMTATFAMFALGEQDKITEATNGSVLDLSKFSQSHLKDVLFMCGYSLYETILIPANFAPEAEAFGKKMYLSLLGQDVALGMFASSYCKTIQFAGTVGTGVKDFYGFFSSCPNLNSINYNVIDFSSAEDVGELFCGTNFTQISIPESLKNATNLKSIELMFAASSKLTNVDLTGLKTSNVTTASRMFALCTSLETIDLSMLDLSSLQDASGMFSFYKNPVTLDNNLKNIHFSTEHKLTSLVNTASMFYGTKQLETLDLSSFDMGSSVTNYYTMFGVSGIKTIYSDHDWEVTPLPDGNDMMFYECSSLRGGNGYCYASYIEGKSCDRAKIDRANDDGDVKNYGYFTYKGEDAVNLEYDLNGQACSELANPEYYQYSQTVKATDSFTVQGRDPAFGQLSRLDDPVCTDGSGKTFKCWYLDGDATQHQYKAGDELPATTSTSSYKLIAQWNEATGSSAKAVYDEGSYTLTFYYDNNSHADATWKTDVPADTQYSDSSPFNDVASQVKYVDFTSEFKSFTQIKYLDCWFYGFTNLLEVNNLQNLTTTNVESTVWMFYGCLNVKNLDFSSNDFSNADNFGGMFQEAQSVETIKLGNVKESADCWSLCSGDIKLKEINTGTLRLYVSDFVYIEYAPLYECNLLNKISTSNSWEYSLHQILGEDSITQWVDKAGTVRASDTISGNASGDTYTKANTTNDEIDNGSLDNEILQTPLKLLFDLFAVILKID